MRVLIVSASLDAGGAERIAVDLANGLSRRGADVALMAPNGRLDAELAGGVRRFVFPPHGRSPARAAWTSVAVARAIRRFRPDLIHSHNVRATGIAAMGAHIAHPLRTSPLVATFHGVVAAEDRLAGPVLRLADAVVCVSEDLSRRVLKRGFPAPRVTVIPNAVPAREPLAEPRRRQIDADLDLRGAPVVSSVGRLAAVKGHARFLDAAAAVHAAEPTTRFLVVGEGRDRSALERRAAQLGLTSTTRFTGYRADARDLIARSDILIVASDSEGLSMTSLEALASGVPVVSTPVEGMSQLLATGAGTIATDFTPGALARPALELLADPDRRRRMGAIGRALVERDHGLEEMIGRYATLIERLAGSSVRG
jgi:glycosyltransferase involved in cell wall biosynthesis